MNPRLLAAFRLLGVDPRARLQGRVINSQEAADRFRDELVAESLVAFRRLIKAAHPDFGGSQEQAQELIQAKALVTKCRFRYQPPVPQPMVQVVTFTFGTGTATTSNTATWYPGTGVG